MSETEFLQLCAESVVRDVVATTRLHITLSEWIDPENGIAAVFHLAGVDPTRPVWETFGYVNGGDCFSVHPPGRQRPDVPGWAAATM